MNNNRKSVKFKTQIHEKRRRKYPKKDHNKNIVTPEE